MSRPPVRVIHQLARTGGTLVNRCLGAMQGLLVLSEVHPFDPQDKIASEAARWFGLLDESDLPWLRKLAEAEPPTAFGRLVACLAVRARERGQHLVLRDWTHLDFLGVPFVCEPPLMLRTEAALRDHARPVQAFLVRHPVDQYQSCAARPGMAPHLTVERFLVAYVSFARLAAAHGFHRYEDLVADPDMVLQSLCRDLELPFDAAYRTRWSDYDRLTGDNKGPSRGFRRRDIAALTPRPLSPELAAMLSRDARYRESLDLLGYDDRVPAPP